jgi:hypothetical protein
MSACGGCGRRRRPVRLDMGVLRRWYGRRGSRNLRCCAVWLIWILSGARRLGTCGGIRDVHRFWSASRGSRRISSGWSIRSPAVIRSRRCGGRARAARSLPRRWGSWGTMSWSERLLKAKGYSLQANKKTREGSQHPDRDAQFGHIAETVSEALQAGEPVISVDARSVSWSAISKRSAASFSPSVGRSRSAAMTSRTSSSGTRSPTASMTSPTTRDGSASGSPATPPSSPSTRSSTGENTSASPATRTHRRSRSPPTPAHRTTPAPACGATSCSAWRTPPACGSASATSHQAPRSGTRSSTGCSAS